MSFLCVGAAAVAFTAAAADGVWTAGPGVWTNTSMWADGVLPDAGGTAAFLGSGGTVMVPDGHPFTLSALLVNTNGANVARTIAGETNTLVAPATVRVDAYNFFLSSALAGSDGLCKTGDGTLVLSTPNPLLSGSFQVLGGRVLAQADSNLGQAPATYQADALVLDAAAFGNNDPTLALAETRGVTLGAGGAYLFGRGENDLVMASPIVGPGTLYVNMQSGYVVLSNTYNAYTGGTVVGASGPGYFSAAPTATLTLGADEVIPDGAGAGGLVIDGTQKGVLNLSGKTETVNRLTGLGNAIIANDAAGEGVLHAGTDGADMSFSGSLQAGVVLDKVGAGTLTFSNAAASAGLLLVSEGSVKAETGGAISQTAVLLEGTTLKTPVQAEGQRFAGPLLLSQDSTLDRTGASAPFVWSGSLLPTNAVGVPALAVTGGSGPLAVGSLTVRPAVFGIDADVADGVVFTNRVWLETLPASASWTIASGADVAIGTPGLLGSGPLTLTDYTARVVASDSLGAGGEAVTVEGAGNSVWFDATRETEGRLSDDPSYAFTASNNVVFNGAAAQAGFDGAGTVTYTGTISGSGSLVKNGRGDAVLQAANSFVGAVQVNAGRLMISDDAQLGDSGNGVALAGGYLGNGGASPLTLARTITAASGGVDVPGEALTLTGAVSGSVTKRGAGVLTLGGAADNAALDLYVAEGSVDLAKSGALAVRHLLGVDAGAVLRLAGSGGDLIGGNATLTGGALDLNGASESVAMLSSTSLVSCVTNSGAPATLTVGEGGAASTFYGSLANAAVTLIKTGTNLFTMAGASGAQHEGALNVQGGTMAWGTGVRHVRMRPGATRSGAAPAVGEIQLTLRGRPLPWPSGSSTMASSSVSSNTSWMVDDNNSRSYWLASSAPAWVSVDAKTPQVCDGYRWYTSNTDSGSDPLNWTVEVSADNVSWFAADVRTNQAVTTARGALAGEFSFAGTWPNDAAGDATSAEIAAGATLRVQLPEEAAAGLAGSGALALAGGSALRVEDISGYTGNVSGNGQLLLGSSASFQTLSAASKITAINDGLAPATVTVGAAGEPLFAAALADGASPLGLTKQGSGTLTMVDSGNAYSGDTRVEQGTLKVQAPMWRFRYIRFNPTMTQNGNVPNSGFVLAISELQLTSNGVVVAYPAGRTITEAIRGTHTEDNPTNAINGSTTDRWLSTAIPNPLTIDTKIGMTFNGYRIYSSGKNGADYARTPTDWTLQGSDDGVNWMTLCGESGVPTPAYSSGAGKLIGEFSARPARFSLPLEFYGETNSAALKLAAVTARYLRFTVTDTRYTSGDFGNTGFQLDELQLMRNGSPLLYPTNTVASAPADGYNDFNGRYFPPAMAVDNFLPVSGDTNRWYSVAMVNPLTVDLRQPMTFDAYRWYTGPNGTGRDPLGWKLEVSNNTTNWYAVDVRTNQAITLNRNAVAGTWALDIPAGLRAVDVIPDGSRTYVGAGTGLRIEAGSETVGPLSGAGTVSLGSSVFGLNGFEDAVFTGGITGTGTVAKTGAATQALAGALSFSGDIVVDAGTLDLTGATLDGVTNIVVRSGGTLAGAASVSGNLTVAFEGGATRANLDVSGTLTVTGSVTLVLPESAELPYTQRLFAYASADAATKAALAAATTLDVPAGYQASVIVTGTQARWAVAAPGTRLLVK